VYSNKVYVLSRDMMIQYFEQENIGKPSSVEKVHFLAVRCSLVDVDGSTGSPLAVGIPHWH